MYFVIDNSQSENIMKLKRRFLKDRSGANVFYAKRELARKKMHRVFVIYYHNYLTKKAIVV